MNDDVRKAIQRLTAPKPQPILYKAPTPVELAQQAARILEGTYEQPAILGYEPRDIWLGFKIWTINDAAWLALNIDPFINIYWLRKNCHDREPALNALAMEMEHWLLRLIALKANASPKTFVRVMRRLDLNHPWMETAP